MQEADNRAGWGVMVAVLLVVAALIGSSVLLIRTRPQPVEIVIVPPDPTATPLPTSTPAPMLIYVTGQVFTPGTYSLPRGARVADAIDAAGGALSNADMVRVNVADVLRDGQQVHVPMPGAVAEPLEAGVVDSNAQTAEALDLATPTQADIVNVNTANAEELATLPNIGPALAERIIAYREANGPFSTLAELDNVSGIGPSTLENIAERVSFD